MNRITVIAASALLAAPLVITAGPASASPSVACPPVRHANGHKSLREVTRRDRFPLSGELITMVMCSQKPGLGLTKRERAYLDAGNMRADMPRGMWYYTGPGTGGLPG